MTSVSSISEIHTKLFPNLGKATFGILRDCMIDLWLKSPESIVSRFSKAEIIEAVQRVIDPSTVVLSESSIMGFVDFLDMNPELKEYMKRSDILSIGQQRQHEPIHLRPASTPRYMSPPSYSVETPLSSNFTTLHPRHYSSLMDPVYPVQRPTERCRSNCMSHTRRQEALVCNFITALASYLKYSTSAELITCYHSMVREVSSGNWDVCFNYVVANSTLLLRIVYTQPGHVNLNDEMNLSHSISDIISFRAV